MSDGANSCLTLDTNSNGIDLNINFCLHTSCNLQQHTVQTVTWDLVVTHIQKYLKQYYFTSKDSITGPYDPSDQTPTFPDINFSSFENAITYYQILLSDLADFFKLIHMALLLNYQN